MHYFFLIIFLILLLLFIIVITSFRMYLRESKKNLNIIEGLTNKNDEENTTIILIGDSILNNTNYILNEGESVPDLIKAGHSDTYVFAKDEAVISDCNSQIEEIPQDNNTDKTYIFVSAGGNNILNSRNNMSKSIIDSLFQQYSTLIYSLMSKFPNTNIYILSLYYPLDSQFNNLYPFITQWTSMLFEFAETNKLKVIYTNKLLTEPEDFTNSVEPSEAGGKKIADAILES